MMVGVGIALAVVMTFQAMSRANLEIYTADYLHSGVDLYVVTQGGTLIPVLPSDTPGTIKHARNVLAQVRGLPGVNAALGVMSWSLERERPGPRRRDEPTELLATLGVDGDPTLIPDVLLLKQGRWVRRADEVVLGAKLSREKSLAIGDSLRLDGRDFTVVGIGRLRGFGFSGDSLAYMDYRAFRQRAEIGDVVNIIALDTSHPDLARERIPELGSLAVFDPPDLVRQAEAVNQTAVVLYWVFNSLSLAIGALFIGNMLGHSVAERRLEFATLRAIGVPSRTILLTVALEALLVSVAAGAIGVALSLLLGAAINGYMAPIYGLESLYSADVGVFAQVVLLALALGLIAGLFPARQATRVDPVDVLREA
jgi:putative ABC transport system permease protein